jgi:hypothetical protein
MVVFEQFGLLAEVRFEELHLDGSATPRSCSVVKHRVVDSLVDSRAGKNVSVVHFVQLKLLQLDQAVHHQRTLRLQSNRVRRRQYETRATVTNLDVPL